LFFTFKTEEAIGDHKQAAPQSSFFAKQQTAALNPYAALCNVQSAFEDFEKVKTGQAI
jgi:hypothetical protein